MFNSNLISNKNLFKFMSRIHYSNVSNELESKLHSFVSLIFAVTRVAGAALIVFGLIQFGMSFSSHDSSQRMNGVLVVFGGLVIVLAKEIVSLLTGQTFT